MSAGMFPQGIAYAFAQLKAIDLWVTLLRAWPPADATSINQLEILQATDYVGGGYQKAYMTEDAVVDGVACIRNVGAVAVGKLKADVTDIVGWLLFDSNNKPVAWGPLVDSAGVEITRSFVAGDELTFPGGTLAIGLS